jgi:hypothetical protein
MVADLEECLRYEVVHCVRQVTMRWRRHRSDDGLATVVMRRVVHDLSGDREPLLDLMLPALPAVPLNSLAHRIRDYSGRNPFPRRRRRSQPTDRTHAVGAARTVAWPRSGSSARRPLERRGAAMRASVSTRAPSSKQASGRSPLGRSLASHSKRPERSVSAIKSRRQGRPLVRLRYAWIFVDPEATPLTIKLSGDVKFAKRGPAFVSARAFDAFSCWPDPFAERERRETSGLARQGRSASGAHP